MKLAIFSDSHGSTQKMFDAITELRPDAVVHLGDGERDVALLKERFPDLPVHAVRGNCDFLPVSPETELFEVCGVRIFITHGHLYGVKSTRAKLLEEAARRGASVAMYGHTHTAQLVQTNDFFLLNPGSCGYAASPSCAELLVSPDGTLDARIIRL